MDEPSAGSTTPEPEEDKKPSRGRALVFDSPDPWPEQIETDALLELLVATVHRYVIVDEHQAVAVALWTALSYTYDRFDVLPILAVTSPDKRCDKSTLLALLTRMCRRPLPASNISPAALFRTIEAHEPTLLIDELDSFLKDNDELRGILNSGHTRDLAYVIRVVGEGHDAATFSTWSPKAIAKIGKLPATLADRSIEINMRRKLRGESVERIRRDDDEIQRKLTRWSLDVQLARYVTTVSELHDRAQDNWEPLLCIAGHAGGEWPSRARDAARNLTDPDDGESIQVELLMDVRAIFDETEDTRIFSETLVENLVGMADRPWMDWNRGKGLTPNGLVRLLRPFKIKPGTVRVGAETAKGYKREQFKDAWTRYTPIQNVTTSQVTDDAGSIDFQSVTRENGVTVEKPLQATDDAGCDVVTVERVERGQIEDLIERCGLDMSVDTALTRLKQCNAETVSAVLSGKISDASVELILGGVPF